MSTKQKDKPKDQNPHSFPWQRMGPNANAGKQSKLKAGGNRADKVLRKFD